MLFLIVIVEIFIFMVISILLSDLLGSNEIPPHRLEELLDEEYKEECKKNGGK